MARCRHLHQSTSVCSAQQMLLTLQTVRRALTYIYISSRLDDPAWKASFAACRLIPFLPGRGGAQGPTTTSTGTSHNVAWAHIQPLSCIQLQ